MSRRVWLDDIRKKPFGFDVWVNTADEAIAALAVGDVELISLDHDLAAEHYPDAGGGYGEGSLDRSRFREKTGYDVVLWMAEHNVWPKEDPRAHDESGRTERHGPDDPEARAGGYHVARAARRSLNESALVQGEGDTGRRTARGAAWVGIPVGGESRCGS